MRELLSMVYVRGCGYGQIAGRTLQGRTRYDIRMTDMHSSRLEQFYDGQLLDAPEGAFHARELICVKRDPQGEFAIWEDKQPEPQYETQYAQTSTGSAMPVHLRVMK